jgi:hypothetical protein
MTDENKFQRVQWDGDQWHESDDDGPDGMPLRPRGAGISADDLALLTLAARAIGAQVEIVDGEDWVNLHFPDGSIQYAWNPILGSDNALDLAVDLNLHISIDCESAGTVTIEWDFGDSTTPACTVEERAPVGRDDRVATRRAITRAAAEIGKAMSQCSSVRSRAAPP